VFHFPESLSAEDFLDRYWQTESLFMPLALPGDFPILSADELAWLATLDDVESRLVFSEREQNTTSYRVELGPFDDTFLASLPPENWTLLVQDVEKHLPDFRLLLSEASFIPDWRIDDLMVSFAVAGGSVGPHRDNYDVFLCQGRGRREWRVASAGTELRRIESGGLSLLEPFVDDNPITVNEGDVLYLPPGVPHWGIATEASMTYSIGMRAPTLSQIGAALARIRHKGDKENCDDDSCFYNDPDLVTGEAEPGRISARALLRARHCFSPVASKDDADLALAFGIAVSDVKPWLTPETVSDAEIDVVLKSLRGEAAMRVHGMARLAFCSVGERNFVFANGNGRAASLAEIEVFRRLCRYRSLQKENVDSILKDSQGIDLFRWLVGVGAFDFRQAPSNDET
jgi:50S ribosomal protein L16 3-hydroxylase